MPEIFSWWRDPSQSEDAHCLQLIDYGYERGSTEAPAYLATCGVWFKPRVESLGDYFRCDDCKRAIERYQQEHEASLSAFLDSL